MKKYIKTIFTSICIAIFYLGLSGCSLFESDNDIRVEIVKACDENNFAEAYMLSDKLEDKREDIKYIVRRECIFNLEKNGENSLPKIVTIVSEQNASWVYNDLLKVAIVMGNEPLAKKLFNLYPECDQEIISSATNADFEELIFNFIDKNYNVINNKDIIDYLNKKGIYKTYKEEKERLQIESLRSAISAPLDGIRPPSGTIRNFVDKEYQKDEFGDIHFKEYIAYCNSLVKHNKNCLELLHIAIQKKNSKEAKFAISQMKESIVVHTEKSGTSYHRIQDNQCIVEYSKSNITEAEALYKKAFK